MKNKQILFILLLIAPYNLDASVFEYLFPSFTTSKKASLNELVNKELDKEMNRPIIIPQFTRRSPAFYQARHNSCREAYITTLLEECVKLQKDEKFKNNPTLIHETAVKKANRAHQEIYTNFDKIYVPAIKTTPKETQKKIPNSSKTYPQQKPLAPNVYIDPRLIAQLIHQSQQPTDHGYTKIENQRSRNNKKIAYDQSKPHVLGGEQTKTRDEIKKSWADRF